MEHVMELPDALTEATDAAIANRVFPGCVIGVVRRDGERLVLPFGHFTYEEGSTHVRRDTMYDSASLTKSLVTGSLALQFLDEGRLSLDDRLIWYVPELKNEGAEDVRIRHLLTYTVQSGTRLSTLKDRGKDGFFEALYAAPFAHPPGSHFFYSNTPSTLLGLALERIGGKTLDELADKRFFKPLGMTRTTFFPERFSAAEIPPTETDNWRGEVRGKVHDESAYVCKQAGKIVGHAGLFTTADDVLTYLEMLLKRGEFDGRRYFSEKTIDAMQTNQIAALGDSTSLGWELFQPRYMGRFATEHTFGKTGFTGTLALVDIPRGVACVILSNRTYPKRPKDSTAINAFRKAVSELVLAPETVPPARSHVQNRTVEQARH